MVKTASTFSDAFHILLEAYRQISEQLPLLSQYAVLLQREDSKPAMSKVLVMIYEDIVKFHARAMKYFKQRSRYLVSIAPIL
jgi:hypothetical protein